MNTDTNEAKIFETRFRDAIAERKAKGKAPAVPNVKVEKFIAQCVKLRFEPGWKLAGVILGRIVDEQLYLLSDDDRQQFSARLASQPKDQLAERSADAHAETQADDPAAAESSDSPMAVQTDLIGQDVANDSASKSAIRRNGKLEARVAASPRPENRVTNLPIDDEAQTQQTNLQPALNAAEAALTGAKPGCSQTGAEVQAGRSSGHTEILYGKHAGIYSIHVVAALYNRVIGQPRENMKKSLSRHGQQEPVVALGKTILDGLTRIELMNELGLAPVVVQFSSLNTKLTPGEWIMVKNYNRRNVSDDQWLAIGAAYEALVKAGSLGEPKPHDETEAGATTQNDAAATGADSATSEYRQKPAENTPPKKRGRPRGRRGAARAVAARTGQSRYRAEAMIKIREEAPDLAAAVHRGELKLKEAMARLKERQKSQAGAAPVAKPQRSTDEQRVKDAMAAGFQALREIMRKRQVRAWERVPFWRGIADLARREAAMDA